MSNRTSSLIETVENNRPRTRIHSTQIQHELGQFLTPGRIASFMSEMFDRLDGGKITLLDPGAGIGSLTAAFVETLSRKCARHAEVELFAYEIDRNLIPDLTQTLKACRSVCEARGLSFDYHIMEEDFILSASDAITRSGGLFAEKATHFTHCIMNPPYKKLASSSIHRKALHRAGIETSNFYSAFVSLAIELLEQGGEIAAIIPRSFCNGVYFRPFRKQLRECLSIDRIHLFGSRKEAFGDDGVLQENVIFHGIRGAQQPRITISHSVDSNFGKLTDTLVPRDQIFRQDDAIHIPVSDGDRQVVSDAMVFDQTLNDLGIEVSTGPVVDFRLREHLSHLPTGQYCPLIYSHHFADGGISWPAIRHKKPDYISINPSTERWLFPNGCYILTRRFSSKEERRRLVSVLYVPDSHDFEWVAFENHLNVIHRGGKGLDPHLARGLSIFLNSTLADKYFRQFSGHTQVNANDLRNMAYPDRLTLKQWGKATKKNPSQQDIDSLVDQAVERLKAKNGR